EIATRFLKLQVAEERHTSLDERIRQVVILTVGAVWRAPYELYAHSAVAHHSGWPSRSLLNWSQAVSLTPSPMRRKPPTGSPGRCPPSITSMTISTIKPSKHSAPQVFSNWPRGRVYITRSAPSSTPLIFPP